MAAVINLKSWNIAGQVSSSDQDVSDEASHNVGSDEIIHDSKVNESPSVENSSELPKYGGQCSD